MDSFTTVYDFTNQSFTNMSLMRLGSRLFIVIAIGIMIYWHRTGRLGLYWQRLLKSQRRGKRAESGWGGPLFILLILAGGALMGLNYSMDNYNDVERPYAEIVTRYQPQDYLVAEGCVEVLSQQPAAGHGPHDEIRVGTSGFEINYYSYGPWYKQTISHDGVLRENRYVRIAYVNYPDSTNVEDAKILRIELRDRPCVN